MAGQYKNVTVDGKEIDSKGSLFQVLDNSDSGLPKNIPNVFKCNLARQDGSYKFFKNGLPVVWFAKLEDGRYERLATTESVLYKNANDVYFVDETFNITGVAYCFYEHVGNSGIEYVAAKIKELLENDEFTILSGNNFEHASAESKFSILAEEETTSEKLSRGFVGCYNCNDGYPNNLEDCPYCSGRGRFYGTKFGWHPTIAKFDAGYIYPEEFYSYNHTTKFFILNDEERIKDRQNYLASNVWWQSVADLGDDAYSQLLLKNTNDSTVVSAVLGQYGGSTDIETSAVKFNINGNVINSSVVCETCDGRGYIDGIFQKCNTCSGNGYHTSTAGSTMWWIDCLHCADIHNVATKSPMNIVRNTYSKLLNNMTDETMPIMRGKRIKNNTKIGYDICDLCKGTGVVNSYNGITNYDYLTGRDDASKIYVEINDYDDADIVPNGCLRTVYSVFNKLFVYNDVTQQYVTLYFLNHDVLKKDINGITYYQYKNYNDSYEFSLNNAYVEIRKPKLKSGETTAITTCTACNGTCIDASMDVICNYCHGVGLVSDYEKYEWETTYVALSDPSIAFYDAEKRTYIVDVLDYMYANGKFSNVFIDFAKAYSNENENALKNYFASICGTSETYSGYGYFGIKEQPMANLYAYMWGNAFYGERTPMESGFLCQGANGRGPCPACFNEDYFYNNECGVKTSTIFSYSAALERQRAIYDEIALKAKNNGASFKSSFKQVHSYSEPELKTSAFTNELGATAFCDTCNPNGIPETHFKDGLIVSPNSQGIYPEGTETVVGLIDCNTCGNNGLEAGEMVCTGCLGIRHWFCTTCSGDGEVEYRPTVAYEDGKKVAVGDGYYYENLFPNATSAFNLYKDYINIKPNNNCDIGRGEYIKKMNLFSVENNGLLTVHNNNYDDVPTSDVKHNLNRDFFAVRDWAKYDSLDERFANLQNCCYAPDAIYFPKRTAHNEEWKLRIRELYYLITDSYIKTNASMLKTNALNQAIADFYTNNTTYLLKLGPIITYAIKGVWRKGAKGSKGVKGVTAGTKGKKGMKGLKGLKGTKGAKGYYEKIVIENKRYKYTLPDILNAIYAEYGQRIMNSGNLGKDDKTYTFYCINEDSENYLWFKGVRIRQLTKGRYQTLNVVKGCKPYGVQRIVYKNNGYNGEYGVMNFQYSRNREFLT